MPAAGDEAGTVGEVAMVGDVGPALLPQQRRRALALPVGVLDHNQAARLEQFLCALNHNAHYIESVFAGEQRERGVVFADLRIDELALVLGDVRRVRSDNVHAAVELGKRLGDVSEM